MKNLVGVKDLLYSIKNKDTNTIKKNGTFIVQTIISITILLFCISYIITGKASDQNDKTIVWSLVSTIVGVYLPSASFNKKSNSEQSNSNNSNNGQSNNSNIPNNGQSNNSNNGHSNNSNNSNNGQSNLHSNLESYNSETNTYTNDSIPLPDLPNLRSVNNNSNKNNSNKNNSNNSNRYDRKYKRRVNRKYNSKKNEIDSSNYRSLYYSDTTYS